jgi:hypothetical protein
MIVVAEQYEVAPRTPIPAVKKLTACLCVGRAKPLPEATGKVQLRLAPLDHLPKHRFQLLPLLDSQRPGVPARLYPFLRRVIVDRP